MSKPLDRAAAEAWLRDAARPEDERVDRTPIGANHLRAALARVDELEQTVYCKHCGLKPATATTVKLRCGCMVCFDCQQLERRQVVQEIDAAGQALLVDGRAQLAAEHERYINAMAARAAAERRAEAAEAEVARWKDEADSADETLAIVMKTNEGLLADPVAKRWERECERLLAERDALRAALEPLVAIAEHVELDRGGADWAIWGLRDGPRLMVSHVLAAAAALRPSRASEEGG